MTIRLRNRITFFFSLISLVLFILSVIAITLKYIKNSFIIPDIYIKGASSSPLLSFNSNCVIISILILLAYVYITSFIIYRSFEKSQATDMLFFLIFLAACMIDTARIVITSIPFSGAYSNLLLKIGNITLFARLLAPLALFGATVLSKEEFHQYTEQNCLIIIIAALFFAGIIPLNSAYIMPNFSIGYGYIKSIHYLTFTICAISTFGLFIINKKNEYNQLMTLGFAILCIGYSIVFESYNILMTIIGPILLGLGTTIYLSEVHKRYLWLD